MSEDSIKTQVASFFTPAARADFNKTKLNIVEQPSSHIKKITFDHELNASVADGSNTYNILNNNFHDQESDEDLPRFKIKMPKDPDLPKQLSAEPLRSTAKPGGRASLFNRVMRRLSVSRSNLHSTSKDGQQKKSLSNQTIASGKSENSALTSSRPSLLKRFMSTRKKDLDKSINGTTRWTSDELVSTPLNGKLSHLDGTTVLPDKIKVNGVLPPANPRVGDRENGVHLNSSTSQHHPIIMPSRLANYKPSYLNLSVAAYGYHGAPYSRLLSSAEQQSVRSSSLPPQPRATDSSHLLLNSVLLEPLPWKRPRDSLTDSKPRPGSRPTHLVGTSNISTTVNSTMNGNENVTKAPSEESTKHSSIELRSRNRTRSTTLDKENPELDQWQRNSLIMMTVAKNSPRNKTDSVVKTRADSPTMTSTQTPLVPPPDLMSKSAHEALSPVPQRQDSKTLTHDGHYFLLVVDRAQTEIEQGVEKIEQAMLENKDAIHEEVNGALCTTVGMARLLLREKFAQFRGLCKLNIERMNSGQEVDLAAMAEAPEKFASGDDLAGFWAMVHLQVENVRKMFAEADKFAENGWQPIVQRRHSVAVASSPRLKVVRKPLAKPTIQPVSEEAAAASEARSAALQEQKRVARERMLKMKQEMMAKRKQESQNQTNGDKPSGFMVI